MKKDSVMPLAVGDTFDLPCGTKIKVWEKTWSGALVCLKVDVHEIPLTITSPHMYDIRIGQDAIPALKNLVKRLEATSEKYNKRR